MRKNGESIEAITNELKSASGANINFDKFIGSIERELREADDLEWRARRVVERLALALQASVLLKTAPNFVGDAFCSSRLTENYLSFGTLPTRIEIEKIIARSMPKTKEIQNTDLHG
jgi:putative acyl-CoA dehydrogenase